MMSVVGGLTAANLYYNQPLLEEMRASLGIGEKEANLITVITQIGYALGLLFVVPMFGSAAVIMLGSLLVTLRMMPVMLSSFSGTYRALIATVGKILGLCGVAGAVAASGVGKYILKDLRKFVGCSIVIPKYVMLCFFL